MRLSKTIALSLAVFVCASIVSCSRNYDPGASLSAPEQDKLLTLVIRYLAKAPEGISPEERFYAAYDPHYQQQKSQHRMDAYFRDGDVQFVLVSRQAPSLTEKRVATGLKLSIDADGKLVEYEEVFRTWKMTPDTLVTRSIMLFDKMVDEESLEPYLTKNSMPVEYIEFPDDRTYFDKATRSWQMKP